MELKGHNFTKLIHTVLFKILGQVGAKNRKKNKPLSRFLCYQTKKLWQSLKYIFQFCEYPLAILFCRMIFSLKRAEFDPLNKMTM